MNEETTYNQHTEVWISPREQTLLRCIRRMNAVLAIPCMVTVRSKNGRQSFGFPGGDVAVVDVDAYVRCGK